MIYDEFGSLDNAENAFMSMFCIEAGSSAIATGVIMI